jgi:hypothetical protein
MDNLQLGDIVKIIAETDPKLNEHIFYIHYYDPNDFIELVNVSSMETYTIRLKNGKMLDSPIQKIILLSRSSLKGFARQNGLLANTWVDLEFSGELRSVVIAQITRLEEDMIELTTFPDKDVIYIDFAYKGIPKHIPLKKICFCSQPASFQQQQQVVVPTSEDEILEEVRVEFTPQGEMMLDMPVNLKIDEGYKKKLHDEFTKNMTDVQDNDNEYVGEIESVYYGLDAQLNFLMDDFLSTLPDEKRTKEAMRQVYIHLNRFTELREIYSTKNSYGQINGFRNRDVRNYKPLVDHMYNLKNQIHWLKPVANITRHIYGEFEEKLQYNDLSLHYIGDGISEEMTTEKQLFRENNAPSTSTTAVKYENMYNTLAETCYTPFSPFPETVFEPLAKEIAPLNDVDIFTGSNNTMFSSSVYGDNKSSVLLRKKYNMARINAPVLYSRFLNKKDNEMRTLMGADNIELQSTFIILPEDTMRKDMNLDSNILNKTKYRTPYFQNIMRTTPVAKRTIDLQKENEDIFPLNDQAQEIILDSQENEIHNSTISHPLYNAFLQKLIPNTFSLIEHFYQENANKLNMSDYLATFSPYKVVADSLSFSSQQKIGRHIFQNIRNYTTDYVNKKEMYTNYALYKYQLHIEKELAAIYIPFQDKYLSSLKKGAADNFKKLYPMATNNTRTYNFSDIYSLDNGSAFALWLLMLNVELITPVNMVEPFIDPKTFYDSKRKTIAKKYNSLKEMQEDNDTRDLKFDKEYDVTDYDVLKKYRKERSKYTPEQFLPFLQEQLAKVYGCSMDNTKELADDILLGHKLVKEGDFAVLQIIPKLPPGVEECSFSAKEKEEIEIEVKVRKIKKYFCRMNHVWVYDPDIDDSQFAKPKELTCALKSNRDYVVGNVAQEMFKNQYGETIEKITSKIQEKLIVVEGTLKRNIELRKRKRFEVDSFFSKLGNQAYISENIPSPNESVLSKIMHKSRSFEGKQASIVQFYQLYCRDPYTTENQFWKYCRDSKHSVPLLPRAIYDLAVGFSNGEYISVMSRLIKEKLVKHEDGRLVVTHGGHMLDEIEFSDNNFDFTEDSSEEKNSWTEGGQDEIPTVHYDVDGTNGHRKYGNVMYRQIYNIIAAICKNLFIQLDMIEDTTMDLCIQFVSQKNMFMGEAKYNTQMAKRANNNNTKKAQPYETYEKARMLDMSVCCLIVAIQTLVPSFVPRRTFGNCKKILDGYPLNENSGSEGTIEYLACILRKMYEDKRTLPWSTIGKSAGMMESRLKSMFETVLKNDKVNELLKAKRVYMLESNETIPEYLRVANTWPHFLPPIQRTRVIDDKIPLRNIEKAVNEELKKRLKDGSADQWKYLGMYFSKMLSFSFGTLELINDIVREKGSLLGKFGKTPWLENACCNEIEGKRNPIQYFAKEDERIEGYVNNVSKLGSALAKIKLYNRAPFLHMELAAAAAAASTTSNTKDLSKSIFCQYSEEMMYRTLIRFCRLDSEIKPIPSYLENFISEKNEKYEPKWSIEEKIAFLKEQGKGMNLSKFNSLMSQIYKQHLVILPKPIQISYHDTVIDLLTQLKEEFSGDEKTKNFSTHFESYVNREYIEEEKEVEDEEDGSAKINPGTLSETLLDNLENFLQTEIDNMQVKIRDFMQNLRIRKDVIDKLLKQLNTWENGMSYTVFGNFVKNYIYYLCNILPSYITSGNKILTCKYKILLSQDYDSLSNTLDKKYDYLEEFQNDELLAPFMTGSVGGLRKMYKFLSKFNGFFPEKRDRLYGRYFLFSLHFVFYYFITMTEDETVLKKIFQHVKSKEAVVVVEEEEEDSLYLPGDEGIQAADRGAVQLKVSAFIQKLLDRKEVFNRDKKSYLTTYDEIRNNVDRLEDAEKKRIMKRFEMISEHRTRRAEFTLKKYHLGDYYVDQNIIKTYGTKRDKMLNTEDVTEDDFLFRDGEADAELEGEKDHQYNKEEMLDIFGQDSDDDEDNREEEVGFLGRTEEEDNYDMAENGFND